MMRYISFLFAAVLAAQQQLPGPVTIVNNASGSNPLVLRNFHSSGLVGMGLISNAGSAVGSVGWSTADNQLRVTTFGAHPIYFLTSGAARGYIDTVGLKIDNTAAADFLLTLKNNSTSGYSAFNALDSAGVKQSHFGWANSAAALGPSSTHISTGGPLRFYYQTGLASTEIGYFNTAGSGSWTWLARTTIVSSETADFNHPMILQNTGTNGSTTINFLNSSGTAKAVVGYQATCVTGCSDAFGATSLTMRTKSTDPITFWTNNTERLRIGGSGDIILNTALLPSTAGGTVVGNAAFPFGLSYFKRLNVTNDTGVGYGIFASGGNGATAYFAAGDSGAPALILGGNLSFASDATQNIGTGFSNRAGIIYTANVYGTSLVGVTDTSGNSRSVLSGSGLLLYDNSVVNTVSISRTTGIVDAVGFAAAGTAGITFTATVSGCQLTFTKGLLTAQTGTC